MKTTVRGKAKGGYRQCKASTTEEPGAVVPHAGICAGAVGQLAVLPR
jgi:hypothetical protein